MTRLSPAVAVPAAATFADRIDPRETPAGSRDGQEAGRVGHTDRQERPGIWLHHTRIALLVLWPVVAYAMMCGLHPGNQWICAYLYLWTSALVVGGALSRRFWSGLCAALITDVAVIAAGAALVALSVRLIDCGVGSRNPPIAGNNDRARSCHGAIQQQQEPVVGGANQDILRFLEDIALCRCRSPSVEEASRWTPR